MQSERGGVGVEVDRLRAGPRRRRHMPTSSGVITRSAPPTAPFPAQVGDNVAVTFETDEASVSTCVVVRDGVPSAVEYCTQ
jgi:hypothetical protein